MSEKKWEGPSLKTIFQAGLLAFIGVIAFEALATNFFSKALFSGDPGVSRDALGNPAGFLPSLVDIIMFCFLAVLMSVFGLWPMVGKFIDWVRGLVSSAVGEVKDTFAPDHSGKHLDPMKVKEILERFNRTLKDHGDRIHGLEVTEDNLLDFKARVEEAVPETVVKVPPPPPTIEELQAQIAKLQSKLEEGDKA